MTEEIKPTNGATPESPPAETPPDPAALGRAWLESAPADEIRKHPRFGGILGETLARERERIRDEARRENEQAAAQKAHEELRQLARTDYAAFAERWLSEDQQQTLKAQLDDLHRKTRTEIVQNLGHAFAALPEWAEPTPEEQVKLARALEGKSEEDVPGAFAVAFSDLLADRRAAKRHAEWQQKELAKERDAIRQEEVAKRLARSESPDLARGGQARADDHLRLDDPREYNAWYEKNVLKR